MGKAGRGGCSTLWESVCGKRKGDDAMRRGAFIFIRIDCIDDDAAHVTFSSDPNSLRASALPLVKCGQVCIWLTADLCHRLQLDVST